LRNVAPEVFDHPIDEEATKVFLGDPRHHLVVAVEAELVVGFASAVHCVHPDKPVPELWVNEVGVAPTHRRRGIGKALLDSLLQVARDLDCGEAWVLTDLTNASAMRLYASRAGSEAPRECVMFTFRTGDAPTADR
jgi:aminoglycoside 6'-N-acetyltransferase I